MNCPSCSGTRINRNGFYTIKRGKSVLRLRCCDCGKSFRSYSKLQKQEMRGRSRVVSIKYRSGDSYSQILQDLILYYGYKLKISFYKTGELITGKSRSTIRRYISKGNKNLNQNFIVKVFVKVKADLEMLNNGRLSLSMYKRLQNIANRIVKVTLGPPLSYVRGNTIIWNKKSPQYKEILQKCSQY